MPLLKVARVFMMYPEVIITVDYFINSFLTNLLDGGRTISLSAENWT